MYKQLKEEARGHEFRRAGGGGEKGTKKGFEREKGKREMM